MITKTLYRYEREPGCITVSTEQPTNVEYTEIYRLIADEGKVLTKRLLLKLNLQRRELGNGFI